MPRCHPVSRPSRKLIATVCDEAKRRHFRLRTASSGGPFDADEAVFAAIALRSINGQLVKSAEILFVESRDTGALLGGLNEGTKGIDQIGLTIRHG